MELGKCYETPDCGTKDSTANAGPEHLSSAQREEQSGGYFVSCLLYKKVKRW